MKKIALSLLAAGLLAGNVQAATLNNGGSANIYVGAEATSSSPYTYNFDYLYGGIVTFALKDPADPAASQVSYQLTGGDLVAPINFSLDLASATETILDTFSQALVGGSYALTIKTDALYTKTQVSAVPLPGAALLFGSALLGAGALRRKKQAEEKLAAVAA